MESTVIIGEAVAGEATAVRRQLESLIKNVNKSAFDIGELLHTIKKKGYFAPFNTFQEYVDTLELKARKAQYLRRIAEVMEDVGIARTQYEAVGIAKLRRITSLGGTPYDPSAVWVNPETQEETPVKEFIKGFVEKHEELSIEDIEQHVRTLKGLVGENDLTWLNFCLKRSALDETVRPALEMAKNHIGSVGKDEEGVSKDASDGAALEMVCADYLADPANNVLPESE